MINPVRKQINTILRGFSNYTSDEMATFWSKHDSLNQCGLENLLARVQYVASSKGHMRAIFNA
jgi:hypothetical protein